jgi:hypothetical protein
MSEVTIRGAEMRVDTTARMLALGAPAFAALDAGMIAFRIFGPGPSISG